jgi:phospholipid transport system substrate-binding protein
MEMPVRQQLVCSDAVRRFGVPNAFVRPGGPLYSCAHTGMLPTILILLALGRCVAAQVCSDAVRRFSSYALTGTLQTATDANDPNERWWSRWDVRVKDPNDPNELLEAKWNAVLRVLRAKDLDQQVKERIIDRIVSPAFDFPLMGQLALGRTHWPKLNPAQREKFIRLFARRLKALYLEKTTLYHDEKVSFKPAIARKNIVHIPVVLISGDKETAMLYKLHKLDEGSPTRKDALGGPERGKGKGDGRWKIYDVEIEGVSILLTYRSQFDDILRRGTVADLLSHLEKPPSQ